MDLLLKQLGGLVLGSVPTMILFMITLAAYRLLVHGPLKKILRERRDRTQGAVEKAAAAVAVAAAKTSDYELRLRTARAAVFRERHERLHAVRVESERVLENLRATAEERVATAVVAIEQDVAAARVQLDGSIRDLAANVLKAVLTTEGVPAQEQAG